MLGAVLGFALALGGGKVYEAETLVAMGQPFSPNGGAPVQSFLTNARAVSEIVRSEAALEAAARASGLPRAARSAATSPRRSSAPPAPAPGRPARRSSRSRSSQASRCKAEKAADALAKEVIDRTSAKYVDTKIKAFNDQLELDPGAAELARAADRAARAGRRASRDLAALDKLVLVSSLDNAQARRGQLLDLQSDVQQQLALAENVEKAQVVEPAAAVKTTARSGRNGALIGALARAPARLRGGAPRRPVPRAPRPHGVSRWSTGSASRSSSPPTTRSG